MQCMILVYKFNQSTFIYIAPYNNQRLKCFTIPEIDLKIDYIKHKTTTKR